MLADSAMSLKEDWRDRSMELTALLTTVSISFFQFVTDALLWAVCTTFQFYVTTETYPAIQVKNYVGRAVVVVSCVTKDAPHK